ncbi:MAG TPA: hypothetical protein VFL41_11690 [Gaiellaceae bacterium]|nr:hypothetical protein [Gaiellaceae bacterium]
MAHRLDTVIEHVRALLTAPEHGRAAPARERLELTLTEGYAAALALDGDRMRLERRIEEVTVSLAEGGKSRPKELRKLMARLHDVEDNLADLRTLLEKLRRRAAKAA